MRFSAVPRANFKGLACRVESSLHLRSKMKSVRLRQGYGATVYALRYDASEDWSRGDYAPASASDNEPSLLNFGSALNLGAEGIRTPDPHNAIVVLYQLSYDPA